MDNRSLFMGLTSTLDVANPLHVSDRFPFAYGTTEVILVVAGKAGTNGNSLFSNKEAGWKDELTEA